MYPSGATCLPADCCFRVLALWKKKSNSACWYRTKRTSASSHWKLTCSRHDIAEKLVLNNNHSLLVLLPRFCIFMNFSWFCLLITSETQSKLFFPLCYVTAWYDWPLFQIPVRFDVSRTSGIIPWRSFTEFNRWKPAGNQSSSTKHLYLSSPPDWTFWKSQTKILFV